jgi:PAS domain S-box-containing protein
LRGGPLLGGTLAAVAALFALAMLWLRREVRAHRLPHRWAHTALGVSLTLLLIRGLMGWAVFRHGSQLGILALVILAIGYMCVSTVWAYALIAAGGLVWAAVPWILGFEGGPAFLPLFLIGAIPVAVAIRQARLTTLWREAEQRVRDRYRHAELLAATRRASESELRFRGIFERIHDVYIRVGLDGRIEMISPSVGRYGYTPDDLVGVDASVLFTPADVERGRAIIVANNPVGDIEMRWRCADGREAVMSIAANVLRDAAGAPIGYEGVLRDITERKRLEAERRQQQAELAHVLRLSSMGEMAAEMAHELTQPLAAIANYAAACARYMRADADERDKVIEGLDLIAAQGLRAGAIVRRIRSYVAKRPPQRETADIVALVRQAAHTVGMEAQRATLPIVVEGESGRWLVSVDAIQIEQVIVNLLLNAIESVPTPSNGDRIAIAVRDGGEDKVEVAVSDPGCGLGALATRVFDPFFSTKPSGLGMGLAISRSIIDTHGGSLWATPNVDRGTTFRFTLPRRMAVSREEQPPSPPPTVH